MKILFLDQFSEMGGAQHCLLDLLSPPADDWEAEAALPGDGPLIKELRRAGVPVQIFAPVDYSLGRKTLRDGVRFLIDLRTLPKVIAHLVRSVQPALLYVNGPRLMPSVWRARLECPVLFHSHSRVRALAGSRVVEAALRRTQATVIAASRFLAADWERKLGRGPVRVVYTGVRGPSAARAVVSSRFRVGLIGRFAPQKRQLAFVKAAAEFRRICPRAEFLLAGDALFGAGDYKTRVLEAARGVVECIGWQPRVYDVLRDLDLLVVPSDDEGGVPRVMLEAFAAGVPVLACASGASGEVLEHGVNSFVLREPSASAIVERLREIEPGPEARTAVAERAQRMWTERFTLERYRREIHAAVQSAMRAQMS